MIVTQKITATCIGIQPHVFQILKCYVQECKPTLSLFLKGHYIKDASATDLSSCLLSWCDQDDCNVVFLFDTKCFLITCATAEGCEPELREEKKFENAYMVTVRTVGMFTWFCALQHYALCVIFIETWLVVLACLCYCLFVLNYIPASQPSMMMLEMMIFQTNYVQSNSAVPTRTKVDVRQVQCMHYYCTCMSRQPVRLYVRLAVANHSCSDQTIDG